MASRALRPYPWQRVPRLGQHVRYGQRDAAHRAIDVLLEEFAVEHRGEDLAARKLRCGMVMSYCLRGARMGGAPSDRIMDLMMAAVDRMAPARTWAGIRAQMHQFIDELIEQVIPRGLPQVERLVRRVQRELAQDPAAASRLTVYAREAGLHPDYLSRQFRRLTGQTFCECRHVARVDRARRLLSATDLKVRDIARRVGIHDPSRFARQFGQSTGMTPRQYRAWAGND